MHLAQQIAPHAAENIARHVAQWKLSHKPHVEQFVEQQESKHVHLLHLYSLGCSISVTTL